MRNNNGFTLIELGITVCIIGILASIGIGSFSRMQDRAKNAKTKSSVHIVQLAAEDYAVRHDGDYSVEAADLVPLFPSSAMLENSYSGMRSEPQFGNVASAIGQIGIIGIVQEGAYVGYSITAWGKDEPIMTLSNGN